MSERQFLIQWLSQVARRLRLIRNLNAGAAITFCLLGVAALYQVLRVIIPYTEVVQAMLPLLALAAFGVIAAGLYRMARPASLTEAACVADQRANLHDQLKSAYWFMQMPTGQPAVEALMQRASRTAEQRQPREFLPLQVPKSAWGSLGLALVVGILAWWSPQWTYSLKAEESAAAVAMRSARNNANPASGTQFAPQGMVSQWVATSPNTRSVGGASNANDPLSDESTDSKGAADERLGGDDPKPAPPGKKEEGPGGTPNRRSAQNSQRESPAEWLGSVISRLKEMMAQDDSAGENAAPEGSAQSGTRMAQADNGRNSDAGSANPTPEYRNAERSENSNMAMNSLGGIGPRNAIPGEGEAEEQSGRNNSNSGPMGQRVGTSRGGAGEEGDAPRGNPGGDSESTSVLGKKTQRLAMQLRRVPAQSKSSSEARDEDEGTPEAFFSATRSQAARVEAQDVEATPRAARAEATSDGQTPLAYRTVVKDYFLTQHRKEK